MNQTATALAGLGLFLSGLHLLSQGMQAMAGHRARLLLGRLTGGGAAAAVSGLLLGALTQSTSAVAFICIGLLDGGALSLTGAMMLSAWGSVGTSLLVFLAASDLRLVGFYALGCVALAYLLHLQRLPSGRQFITLGLAAGVLMLGLDLVKSSAGVLRDLPWVLEFFEFSAETPLVSLFAGVIATLIVQSSASVSVLAVTLNLSGVLPLEEALLLVCGASLGSGFSVALVTSHLAGIPRQLALWQCAVKLLGVLVVLPCLAAFPGPMGELSAHLPSTLTVSALVAWVYLALQVAGALAGGILQRRGLALVRWLAAPPTTQLRFAPRHLYAEAAHYPATALTLAEQEQWELIRELPSSLDPLRLARTPDAGFLPVAEWGAGARALCTRIAEFIADTAVAGGAEEWVAKIFALQGRNETLRALLDALQDLVETLHSAPHDEGLASALVESLHLILELLAESSAPGEDDFAVLRELTSDRSQMMEKIRETLLSGTGATVAGQQALYVATSIFERILWLVRRLALSSGT